MIASTHPDEIQIDEELTVGRIIRAVQIRKQNEIERALQNGSASKDSGDQSSGGRDSESSSDSPKSEDGGEIQGSKKQGPKKKKAKQEPLREQEGENKGKKLIASIPRDILLIPFPYDPENARRHLDACLEELMNFKKLPLPRSSVSRARAQRVKGALADVNPKFVENLYHRWLVLMDLDRRRFHKGILKGLGGRERDYRRFRRWLYHLISFGLEKLRQDPIGAEILKKILS